MGAPIGEKSLKYRRKSAKKPVRCWSLCCAVLLYLVMLFGTTTFLVATIQLGGVSPVVGAVYKKAVVPLLGVALYPVTSSVSVIVDAATYALNSTFLSEGGLPEQALAQLADDLGAADVAEFAAQPAATGAKPPLLQGLRVRGGELWPPFRPSVKRYDVLLGDELVAGCDDAGCPAGAPEMQLDVTLVRRGHARIGREVVRSVNGTLRRTVALTDLFRASDVPRLHQGVVVQVKGDKEGQDHTEHYVLKVIHPRQRKAQPVEERQVAARMLAGVRSDLDDAVILQDASVPPIASENPAPTPATVPQPVLVQDAAAAPTAAPQQVSLVQTVGTDSTSAAENAKSDDDSGDDSGEVILDVSAGTAHKVVLRPKSGYCTKVKGILEKGRGKMSVFGIDQDHIVCFASHRGKPVKLQASSFPELKDAARGRFGFGSGVNVSLRPDIETEATWPLESDVASLPLDSVDGGPIKLMGLRTSQGGAIADMPLVVANMRTPAWPIDLQFVERSKGSCEALPYGGERRFACRGLEPGVKLDLALICDVCSSKAGQGGRSLLVQEERPDGEILKIHRRLVEVADSSPWAGWSLTAPEEHGYVYYTIRLGEPGSGEDGGGSAVEYQVGIVVGNRRMPWDDTHIPVGFYEATSQLLFYLGTVASAVYCVVLILQGLGLPAPALAALPTLSAALGALQFLAIIGKTPDAPVQLDAFSRPLMFIDLPNLAVGLIVAVFAVHLLAVIRYIFRNGEGSAEALPSSLLFGGWELRALGLAVLPLAYKAASLSLVTKVPHHSSAPGYYFVAFFETIFGCASLLLLVGLGALCLVRIRNWFFTEQVIGLHLPGRDDIIYVDRLCTQLRAIPMGIGETASFGSYNVLSFWTKSPGWMYSPFVSTITDVEHRGSPGRDMPAVAGSSRQIWEAGPWAKAGAASKADRDDDDLSRTKSMDGSGSRAPGRKKSNATSAADLGLIRTSTDIGDWEGGPTSVSTRFDDPSKRSSASPLEELTKPRITFTPVLYAHPIRVVTEFVYMGGSTHGRLAGVSGLPWLDCAVPAEALEELENELGNVELRVHAGQLSGPLTAGRLGACFDWVDQSPWRFPVEVLLKVVVAAYAAALPITAATTSHWAWVFLHAACMLGLTVVGLFTLVSGPHSCPVDNMASGCSVLAVATGIFQYTGSTLFEPVAPFAAAAMIFFVSVPVVLFFASSLLLLVLSVRCIRAELCTQVVPSVVQNWVMSTEVLATFTKKTGRVAPSDANGYTRMGDSDDGSPTGAPSTVDGSPDNEGLGLMRAYPNCAVTGAELELLGDLSSKLPAKAKVSVVLRSLRMSDGLAVPEEEQPTSRATLPMSARHLFAQRGGGMLVKRPFGALVTEKKGLLLFEQAHMNEGGYSWESVVKKTLGIDTVAADEAIKMLQDALEDPGDAEGTYNKMVVIDVLGHIPRKVPKKGRSSA